MPASMCGDAVPLVVGRPGEDIVTPKMRSNVLNYAGILAMLGPIVVFGTCVDWVSIPCVVLSMVPFVVLAVVSLSTSRCPHCRRFIDLRGSSAYCPRCGKWIGLYEDSQPPRR